MLPGLRDLTQCNADESVILLLNDLFLGLVRERAEVAPSFFRRTNLNLLLRQAVVSSATAMDVYFPALLEAHLPTVIRVRQRNFLPADGEVRSVFQDFRLKLEDLPALLEEEDAAARWEILSRRILEYCRGKTLSNLTGISAVMRVLGIERTWEQISARAGFNERSLREQIEHTIKRRNDIVHRGDRQVGLTDGEPQPIDFAWTNAHVSAVKSVVYACDALVEDAMRELKAEALVV
jgi:hypothetical protein